MNSHRHVLALKLSPLLPLVAVVVVVVFALLDEFIFDNNSTVVWCGVVWCESNRVSTVAQLSEFHIIAISKYIFTAFRSDLEHRFSTKTAIIQKIQVSDFLFAEPHCFTQRLILC